MQIICDFFLLYLFTESNLTYFFYFDSYYFVNMTTKTVDKRQVREGIHNLFGKCCTQTIRQFSIHFDFTAGFQ